MNIKAQIIPKEKYINSKDDMENTAVRTKVSCSWNYSCWPNEARIFNSYLSCPKQMKKKVFEFFKYLISFQTFER